MRLEGLKSIAEGNEFLGHYLSVFNKRFNVAALKAEDLHRPLPKGIDLAKIFSVKTLRALRNDFTVVHEGKLYQIEDNIRTKEVTVEERLGGSFCITYKGRELRYRQILQRPQKISEPRKPHSCKPAAMDNTWRLFRLAGSHKTQISEKAFAGAL